MPDPSNKADTLTEHRLHRSVDRFFCWQVKNLWFVLMHDLAAVILYPSSSFNFQTAGMPTARERETEKRKLISREQNKRGELGVWRRGGEKGDPMKHEKSIDKTC